MMHGACNVNTRKHTYCKLMHGAYNVKLLEIYLPLSMTPGSLYFTIREISRKIVLGIEKIFLSEYGLKFRAILKNLVTYFRERYVENYWNMYVGRTTL
jgi:hypothetical protein